MSQAVTERIEGVMDDAGTESVKISANARKVLEARYLIRDEAGVCHEGPADLFRRVARSIAAAELQFDASMQQRSEWENRFFALMASGRFMPNSPTLMNAGREMGMLSACFVLPVRDSIDAIFDAIKHTALIQKAGGGTGFAFDELRPTGDYIKSSGGCTSGPISFWRAFSEATNAIQQGAFRRGANMGMMYAEHPDILKFLYAKQDLKQFNNYNISIKITDAWMEAFLAAPESPHIVRNPRNGQTFYLPRNLGIWEYDIKSLVPTDEVAGKIGTGTGTGTGTGAGTGTGTGTGVGEDDLHQKEDNLHQKQDAHQKQGTHTYYTRRDIWDIIVRHAWQTGEPGMIFIDRINQHNPTPHIGRMEATNPCGEQPLLPYEACNLGSINLSIFIEKPGTPEACVDWDALRTTIHDSVRFLDDVIEVNNYPLDEIAAICKANRKIGLGVMGFADALFKLNVAYSSEEGVAWGERFMKFLNDEAHLCSEKLAAERGCFPNWEGSIWDTKHRRPMRNACCTTVAPTGTISIIADCSCGIEPLFSLVFYRNVLKGQVQGRKPMIEVNQIFADRLVERGISSPEILDRIATEGALAHLSEIPEDLKKVFVCAHDITPKWHVRMQAAFQRHCDSSISKTINFPESATVEDVESIYRMSYESRCKGVTVYRNGCRDAQPMALKAKDDRAKAKDEASAKTVKVAAKTEPVVVVAPVAPVIPVIPVVPVSMEPRTLPEILSSVRIRQMTPFGNMHVQITVDPKNAMELEVFAQLGKGGDLANSDLEAICRMVSLWLRAGGRLRHVVQQLKGIGSSLQVSTRDGKIMSLGDGLARALTKYTRAKNHFGLESLLLGAFDLEELDRVQRGLAPIAPKNGNGNGQKKSDAPPNSGSVRGTDSQPTRIEATMENRQHQQEAFKVICPECYGPLQYTEGCCMCHSCGYSHC